MDKSLIIQMSDRARIQALDIYLCCTKMSSLRVLKDLETEAHLYRGLYNNNDADTNWSTVLGNARNLVESVQSCIANSDCIDQLQLSVHLAAMSKAETALLFNIKAVRTAVYSETEVYLRASNMMLKSERCLLFALQAHRESDIELAQLWIAAADATSEEACLRAFMMSTSNESLDIDSVVSLNEAEISRARTNAGECVATGNTQTAARWQRLHRLVAVDSALRCCAQYGRDGRWPAPDETAQWYSRCLKASIKLESSIEQMQGDQQPLAAAKLRCVAEQLATMLDTCESDLRVDDPRLAALESNIDFALSTVRALQSRLTRCTEKASHFQQHGSVQEAAAWATATQLTQFDLAALEAAVSAADFALSISDFRVRLPAQNSEVWVSLVDWMACLQQSVVSTECEKNACLVEQECWCFSQSASLLHWLLDFCASLIATPPETCALKYTRCQCIMRNFWDLARAYTSKIAPLYQAAHLLRASAGQGPAQANDLTVAAMWFDRQAEDALQLLQSLVGVLRAEIEGVERADRVSSSPKLLQWPDSYFEDQLRDQLDGDPCVQVRDPAIMLHLVNSQLRARLSNYSWKAESVSVHPALSTITDTVSAAEVAAASVGPIAATREALTTLESAASHFAREQFTPTSSGNWCVEYTLARERATCLCRNMAAYVKCVVEAAEAGDLHAIHESIAVLDAFRQIALHPLVHAGLNSSDGSPLEARVSHCRERLSAWSAAPQRGLWQSALLRYLHAKVMESAGDQTAANLLTQQAAVLEEMAELTGLVPSLRADGRNDIADLCECALKHAHAGGKLPPAFAQGVIRAEEALARLDAKQKLCQEQARRYRRDTTLQKIWTHIAALAMFSTTGLASTFAANPTDFMAKVQSLVQLAGIVDSCTNAAELLVKDMSLVEFVATKLASAVLLPQNIGSASIQDCWRKAANILKQLIEQAVATLLSAADDDAPAAASDVVSARLLVHTKVHNYLSIVHNYFEPAHYALWQSTLSVAAGDAGAELRERWLDATQCFCEGHDLVKETDSITDAHHSVIAPDDMSDSFLKEAREKLVRAEYLAAALKATDPRLRETYQAAFKHSGDAGGSDDAEAGTADRSKQLVKLHAELGYHLTRGVPEDSLSALRAACVYASGTGPNAMHALKAALTAHKLRNGGKQDFAPFICAAKLFAASDAATTERALRILHVHAFRLNDASTRRANHHFIHAAAVDALRLAGLKNLVEFPADISGFPSSILPYIKRYAVASLQECEARRAAFKADNKDHWERAANAFREYQIHVNFVVEAALLNTAVEGATAALNILHQVAERYKKAAMACDAGNADMCECWRLAAKHSTPPSDQSKAPAGHKEAAQYYADAAEALLAGQVPLYEALRAAAAVRIRMTTAAQQKPLKQHQHLELRVAVIAVEAVKAEHAGKQAACALYREAAAKLTLAAQKFVVADHLVKQPAAKAKTAAETLLRRGHALLAKAAAKLAQEPAKAEVAEIQALDVL